MTHNMEMSLEGLNVACEDAQEILEKILNSRISGKVRDLAVELKSELTNIEYSSDTLYNECDNREDLEGYDELAQLLPPANKLSRGEWDSLVDAIQQWRQDNGLPLKWIQVH